MASAKPRRRSVFIDPNAPVWPTRSTVGTEPRYHAYGKTAGGRLLHVTFTYAPRKARKIRVISARDESERKRPLCPTNLRPSRKFRSEAEERKFWETHDTAEYFDLSKAKACRFPNLKLSTTAISLRVPQGLLDRIKVAANKRDVPYQSLIKVWLTEKVDAE